MLLKYDDTPKLGLPHMGHRTGKNLHYYRFDVVPWLVHDVTGRRKEYFYTPYGSQGKGANRLITMLHSVLRRAKEDYGHERHKARKLVLIADSASDNKNNEMFMYCTSLVDNGWFDEIELVFGPVGHTHNGIDATHKIHNVDVGLYFAGDLGHWISNFPKAFHKDIPDAVIVNEVLDWTAYFKDHFRRLSGFWNKPNDPVPARGIRIARDGTGGTAVTFKLDPALEKRWRGADGFPVGVDSPGFYVRLSHPTGRPTAIQAWSGENGDARRSQAGKTSVTCSPNRGRRPLRRRSARAPCSTTTTPPQRARSPSPPGTTPPSSEEKSGGWPR